MLASQNADDLPDAGWEQILSGTMYETKMEAEFDRYHLTLDKRG